MKHFVIGTAGHIDHGKTALIRALTGQDTDRLPEEKQRGITTDLGFASFDLEDGTKAGIIDVPGHERFIHNMAAGAAGMDLVLLVIAADEGIMPQTREHMDILRILGVENYIIVLNKCDLADSEWLEMVEKEIREEQKESGLADAPVVRVSARTGQGIEKLKRLIGAYAQRTEENEKVRKRAEAPARLPVDRVFTVQGFGTVVTGTLLEGRIEKGQELTVFPGKKACRVRGIQVYGREEEFCAAGQRAALNLAGAGKEEIRRGCVLAPEKSVKTTGSINVRIRLLDGGQRIVKNQSRLHFYSGTSQTVCRIILFGADQLLPGEEGYARLLLDKETALRKDDRFVLRFYSPMETIGGGIVLETDAAREKRFRKETLERLRKKETAGTKELAELLTEEKGTDATVLDVLSAEMGIHVKTAEKIMEELAAEGKVCGFGKNGTEYFLHRKAETQIRGEILEELRGYLDRYPYRLGMPEAQLQAKAADRLKKAAQAYIGQLAKQGDIHFIDWGRIRPAETLSWKPGGRLIAPCGYEPEEDEEYRKTYTVFSRAAQEAGYHFLNFGDTDEKTGEILRLLELQGKMLWISGDFYTTPELIRQAAGQVRGLLEQDGKITISRICSMLDTSRKNARLLLEYTDRTGITKKEKAESERVKA